MSKCPWCYARQQRDGTEPAPFDEHPAMGMRTVRCEVHLSFLGSAADEAMTWARAFAHKRAIRVGDRVRLHMGDCHMDVIAIHGDTAWCLATSDQAPRGWLWPIAELKRVD